MKKLLVIGVLMSVMLVGCGTQKETTAVEDSTVSNVVAEAVTEVLTETTETIEETTSIEEETTTEVVEEETTVEEVIEETTEEVEEPAPVEEALAEEPAPVEEVPAPAPVVEEAPVEEPAPEVAPATTGTTVRIGCDAYTDEIDFVKQSFAGMGFTVTNYTVEGQIIWFDVAVNSESDYNTLSQFLYAEGFEVVDGR